MKKLIQLKKPGGLTGTYLADGTLFPNADNWYKHGGTPEGDLATYITKFGYENEADTADTEEKRQEVIRKVLYDRQVKDGKKYSKHQMGNAIDIQYSDPEHRKKNTLQARQIVEEMKTWYNAAHATRPGSETLEWMRKYSLIPEVWPSEKSDKETLIKELFVKLEEEHGTRYKVEFKDEKIQTIHHFSAPTENNGNHLILDVLHVNRVALGFTSLDEFDEAHLHLQIETKK